MKMREDVLFSFCHLIDNVYVLSYFGGEGSIQINVYMYACVSGFRKLLKQQ